MDDAPSWWIADRFRQIDGRVSDVEGRQDVHEDKLGEFGHSLDQLAKEFSRLTDTFVELKRVLYGLAGAIVVAAVLVLIFGHPGA